MGDIAIMSRKQGLFADRQEAGRLLALEIKRIASVGDMVVLGIPRGGVMIAKEIAWQLEADLDVVLSHKLGSPVNPEFAIGAVCEDGRMFINKESASYCHASKKYIEEEKYRQLEVIHERVKLYRKIIDKVPVNNKTVIVTDDGVATGATMQAALWALRQEKPKELIAAIPVGPEETIIELSQDADRIICLETPASFSAIGQFYLNFEQCEDEQVIEVLKQEQQRRHLK